MYTNIRSGFIVIRGGAVVAVIIWQLDLQLPMKSVHITTIAVRSNPAHGQLYSMQHYVIKLVSDVRHAGDFLRYSGFLH